jgi:alpha-L-fucosidase
MHPNPVLPLTPARRRRFQRHRLGLFLHWGLYAIEAWHEQDIWRRQWTRAAYGKLADRFDARRFDPDHWIDVALSAGCDYLVLTTKHIDGFCLWNTTTSEFKSTRSPLGRDVVAAFAAACRRRKVGFGLYFSIVDLHHPAYPHAGRRWEFADPQPGDTPDEARFITFLKAQVTELCTRYGRLHAFWWDGNPAGWRDPSINALIRRLQPHILINNRGFSEGDFGTPERDWDDSVNQLPVFSVATEACQALGSQSWGYRHEEDYYTEAHLQRSIAKILAKGGNYLLNTGPMADGRIAPPDRRILARLGRWLEPIRPALTGEPVSHLIDNRDVLLTRESARVFHVVLHRPPVTSSVALKPFVTLPARATDLRSGLSVEVRNDLLPWDHDSGIGYLRLYRLDPRILKHAVPVIRLEFDRPPKRRVRGEAGLAIEP